MKTQSQSEADAIIGEWLLGGRKRVLECRDYTGSGWYAWTHPSLPASLHYSACEFRLRPIPAPKRMVQWDASDVKPGMVFKTQHADSAYWCQPLNVGLMGVLFISQNLTRSDNWCIGFETLRETWLWSTDGVTWSRCEKESEG